MWCDGGELDENCLRAVFECFFFCFSFVYKTKSFSLSTNGKRKQEGRCGPEPTETVREHPSAVHCRINTVPNKYTSILHGNWKSFPSFSHTRKLDRQL